MRWLVQEGMGRKGRAIEGPGPTFFFAAGAITSSNSNGGRACVRAAAAAAGRVDATGTLEAVAEDRRHNREAEEGGARSE